MWFLTSYFIFFRPYQPYVFQPNFLKQQIRQRELEKAVRLGQVDEANAVLGKGPILNTSSTSALVTSLIEEAGRKKSGRKVIDWASSCALYLEVDIAVVIDQFEISRFCSDLSQHKHLSENCIW